MTLVHLIQAPRSPHCQRGGACSENCCEYSPRNGGTSCDFLVTQKKASMAAERAAWDLSADLDVLLADVHDFAKFKALENQLLDEVAELESGEARMLDVTHDVASTLKAITNATQAGALRLLAKLGLHVDAATESSDVDVAQLEARLAAEKRACAEAAAALEIVRERLEKKRRLLKGLESRRDKYLNDALCEVAFPLGHRYVKVLNELNEIYSLIGSLSSHVGYHDKFDYVAFPKPGWLDSIKLTPREKFIVSIENEHRAFWRSVESQLDADPKAKIKLPVKAA
jgi:hypothetical protein